MTAVAAPAFPAPARRLGLRGGLRNTFTLTWRSVLKIRTNMEDVIGLSLQPIMFLVLFTYVFGSPPSGPIRRDGAGTAGPGPAGTVIAVIGCSPPSREPRVPLGSRLRGVR